MLLTDKRNVILKRILIVGSICLLPLLGSAVASAQHGGGARGAGGLVGTVIGPNDKPVPNAVVTYQTGGGETPHVIRTDAKGHFSVPKLRVDNYDVRASGNGVFSEWEKNISIKPNQIRSVTLRMIYAKEVPKAYVATQTYEPKQKP
jgi:Carboxypeptidase regulatory-like domain